MSVRAHVVDKRGEIKMVAVVLLRSLYCMYIGGYRGMGNQTSAASGGAMRGRHRDSMEGAALEYDCASDGVGVGICVL